LKFNQKLTFYQWKSAKLQTILILECLRLNADTDAPLPRLPFHPKEKKSKKRKKRAILEPNHTEAYKKLAEDYIDKICIWNALQVASAGETTTYGAFVEPILEN
jgi:O6-methylguanine-DNA--protein-cysteine methyltransferase